MDDKHEAHIDTGESPTVIESPAPGGGIGLLAGVPVSLPPAAVAAGIFRELEQHCGWTAPLIEAAVIAHLHGGEKGAKFLTPWGNDVQREYLDAAKHASYVASLKATLEGAGWGFLFPLLDSACALVALEPGTFSVCTPKHLGVYWDVPPLQNLTHLLPWSDPGETAH
jgi:hypothetical protein